MITTPILPIIRQHFPQIAEKLLQEAIAEVGSIHHFKADEVIMDFGQYVRMVPLVIKGSIKVFRENEDGREILLYFLTAGETCSMSFTCCMMHKKSIIRTVAVYSDVTDPLATLYTDPPVDTYKMRALR
jgi:CRP/FNR family transcriptional regulator